MTQHILTLSNYLTNPLHELVAGFKTFFVKAYKAFQIAQMKRAIAIVREEMMRHKAYKDTYNELSKLSDKELRDIGIPRGEIHWIAMQTYQDKV